MKRIATILFALAAVGGGAAWYWPSHRTPAVMRLPGTVEVQEVRLGSQVDGRVAAVKVREGDIVEAGTPVVWFDAEELAARRDQAQHRLEAARAAWEKARQGPLPEEIAEAKAATEPAQARLARVKAGNREEQKQQARADLDAEKAALRKAEDEFFRFNKLGVHSDLERETALAGRDTARGRVAGATAALELILRGSRAEDVTEAAAERARFEARYNLIRRGVRDEDKATAYAAVAEAEAALRFAEHQLREAVVAVPERCVVEVVSVRTGDLVAAGQQVVRVLRADDLWVKVFVPSTELGKLWVGQKVEVAVDSHPGRRFPGDVSQIATVSESNALVREKENGTLEQLSTTPVRTGELMVGKVVPYLCLSFVQFLTIATLMRVVFGVPVAGNFLTLPVINVPFVLAALGIGLMISAKANTREEAGQKVMGSVLPCVFLSGYIFPTESMPAVLQPISNLLPTTWMIDAARGVILRGAGWP
ncbi:ABC transporter permease [Limnoglobus roseus]|uniref:ABC transporter permease n=1 Tax=Limnoglobus roseus TaxID=2598579 RepID=A0A5C1AJH3_9BACT|nr:ABC transporter permease [Limnoglobus roseus]QEL19609.1 ABC transporter permease [Limnoglobus roseus]